MTLTVLLALGICAAATLAHLLSIGLAWHRRYRPPAGPLPPVTILRPTCGLENHLEETLRSGLQLDYPDYEVIFCVARIDDPVVALIRRLMGEHPEVRTALMIGDERISINPKLNNLVKGWEAGGHELVVMADSNVLMPTDYLQRLLARLTPDVGLVCSPPAGSRPDGFAAELECAFLNGYQARWQLAADAAGIGFAQGKTMLWRRSLLDAAGGIRALASEPAEDAASTKLVRRAGLKVRLVDEPFPQPLGRRRLIEVWNRQLRWARLRRVTFGAYFAAEIGSGGLLPITAAAVATLALGASPLWAVGFAGLWYAAEAALVRRMGWPLSLRAPLAWVARDLVLLPLWCAAWAGSGFVWRGNPMVVETRRAEPARPNLH